MCVQIAEMPKKLQDEFEEFHKFNTTRFFGQQADPIADCTSDKYADHARYLCGSCSMLSLPLGLSWILCSAEDLSGIVVPVWLSTVGWP